MDCMTVSALLHMSRQYLRGFIDCMDRGVAFFILFAVQDATTLDGESQSRGNIGLKDVGGMSVKGDRGTVWLFLSVASDE